MRFSLFYDILVVDLTLLPRADAQLEETMLDKIKNFFYDISDMVLSLIIIGVIFYAVSWKISDTLSPDTDLSALPIESEEPETPDTSTPDTGANTGDTTGDGTTDGTGTDAGENTAPETDGTPSESGDGTDGDTAGGTDGGTDADATDSETEEPETPSTELLVFTVDPGASGYSIGQKLEKEGFIKNANDFTQRIIELGVDNRLIAGDFKISKADTLDTIINVLIGKGR